MSDKFNGFSQEEINRVSGTKHKKLTIKPGTFRGHGGIRRMPEKNEYIRQQKISQTNQLHQVVSTNISMENNNKVFEKLTAQSNDSLEDIDLDKSISKSLQEALFYPALKYAEKTGKNHSKSIEKRIESAHNMDTECALSSNENSSNLKLNAGIGNQMTDSTSSSLDDSSILKLKCEGDKKSDVIEPCSLNVESPFKGISLKDFEAHRKMIEEQNRQKKEILYKAIEQHSQKTAAEARKIEEIKAELAKLDNDLAVDVALLRKQIDNACIHFATVEKHYMKIESQFLKAKIELHNAAEKKELLTEHLCTVIAHNEDRKAQQLTELMEKVGLATNENYEPQTSTSK